MTAASSSIAASGSSKPRASSAASRGRFGRLRAADGERASVRSDALAAAHEAVPDARIADEAEPASALAQQRVGALRMQMHEVARDVLCAVPRDHALGEDRARWAGSVHADGAVEEHVVDGGAAQDQRRTAVFGAGAQAMPERGRPYPTEQRSIRIALDRLGPATRLAVAVRHRPTFALLAD